MKFRYQATGSDLIPNKSFWTALPILVKVSNILPYLYAARLVMLYTTISFLHRMAVCSLLVLATTEDESIQRCSSLAFGIYEC